MATYLWPPEISTLVLKKMTGPTLLMASVTCKMWNAIYEQMIKLHSCSNHKLNTEQLLCYSQIRDVENTPGNDWVGLLKGSISSGKKIAMLKRILDGPKKATIVVCHHERAHQWKHACDIFDGKMPCTILTQENSQTAEQILNILQSNMIVCLSGYYAPTLIERLNVISRFATNVTRVIVDCLDSFLPDKGTWLAKILKPMEWKKWIIGNETIDQCIATKSFCRAYSINKHVNLMRPSTNLHILHSIDLIDMEDYDRAQLDVSPPTKCTLPWNLPKITCPRDLETQIAQFAMNDSKQKKLQRVCNFLVDCVKRGERCTVISGFYEHGINQLQQMLNKYREMDNKFGFYGSWCGIKKRFNDWKKYSNGEIDVLLCYAKTTFEVSLPNTNHLIFLEPPVDERVIDQCIAKAISPVADAKLECRHFLYQHKIEVSMFEWAALQQQRNSQSLVHYVRQQMGMFNTF